MQFLHTGLLVLIEIEAEHISLLQAIVFQVSDQLVFTAGIVFFPVPDLHFNDVLLTQLIDDKIGPAHTSGSGLNIIIAAAVDQWADI